MQLREYQQKLKDGLYASWRSGNKNVMLVSPTGSGKTVVMGSIASDQTVPGCIIAHRTELVGQISLALARFGISHNVIGPSSTVKFCISQHISELGRKYYDPRGMVTVAAVDTLVARSDKLLQWSAMQKWWMVDECFPAGTLVDGRPIETIKVGNEVTAFDERTGIFHQRRVTRLFKNPMPNYMVRIASGHHVIYATAGHPFWTQRGWVRACELTENDHVMHTMREDDRIDFRASDVSLSQDGEHLLHEKVRDGIPRRSQGPQGTGKNHDELLHVRSGSEPQSRVNASIQKDRTPVLQHEMLNEIPCSDFFRNDVKNQQEIRFRTHETKQPDDFGAVAREDANHSSEDKSLSENSRRERDTSNQGGSGTDEASVAIRVQGTIRSKDGVSEGHGSGTLQDRLCEPSSEDRHRGGWRESHVDCSEEIGCAERRVSEWKRVESVSLLKRGDIDFPLGGYVYNIEVDDLHTYIAEGIVVHNCHHNLSDNKWGKATQFFTSAVGCGVTATPVRADRRSLHSEQGGVFHDMIVGPTMRELINRGSLCDYRIFAPPQSIDVSNVKIGSTGDYSQPGLREAAHKSKIVGDVVSHYLKLANGLRGIVFTVDVDQATQLAQAFTDAGVPAMAVSAKTPDVIRAEAVRKLRSGKVKVLCNVDLFGEGFDVPAVEVVQMARPTMSYGLYVQQFGRALRTLDGKTHGIIIDHVGNVKRHGLPDAPRQWSLWSEERGKRAERDPDVLPVTTCIKCFSAFEAITRTCPFCGHTPEPENRSRPEFVDGDLIELDPATLAAMRGEIDKIDGDPVIPWGASDVVANSVKKRWRERQEAQSALRHSIALWAGMWRDRGAPDSEIYRRFFFRFGTDIMSAQALGRAEAEQLNERITNAYQ